MGTEEDRKGKGRERSGHVILPLLLSHLAPQEPVLATLHDGELI